MLDAVGDGRRPGTCRLTQAQAAQRRASLATRILVRDRPDHMSTPTQRSYGIQFPLLFTAYGSGRVMVVGATACGRETLVDLDEHQGEAGESKALQ